MTASTNGSAPRLRVAFVGKGGSGKSAIAGTFARLLARAGHTVLAIDSDPMPGLAYSVGVTLTDLGIPEDAVVERAEGEEGPRFRLRPDLSVAEAVDAYATRGPDGVRFLQFTKVGGALTGQMRSQQAFLQIVHDLPDDRWSIVGDLPGGTRQPFYGWGRYAEVYLVVVEPSAKGILSARRLARLARPGDEAGRVRVVLNKVRDGDDVDRVAARIGLPVVGVVPWDEELAEAERQGRPPVDDAADSPAVGAVASLLATLTEGR